MRLNFVAKTTPSLTAAGWLDLARNSGEEPVKAFDTCVEGLGQYPDEWLLKLEAVLSLVRAGALTMARTKFEAFGLEAVRNYDVLVVLGRLLREEGLAATESAQRQPALRCGAAVLREAAALGDGANINAHRANIDAAGMLVLAGDRDEGQSLAATTAAALQGDLSTVTTASERFAVLEILARALVIAGEISQALDLVPKLKQPRAGLAESLAAMVHQLSEIAALQPGGADLLDSLRPAPVAHYTGHIISGPGWPNPRFPRQEEHVVAARIADFLDRTPVSAAYGALAAGADILFAEALLCRGIPLHVVLPFCQDDFIDLSVRPSGAGWIGRFHNCLSRAASVRYSTEDRHLGHDHLFEYGGQLAMGLTVLMAQQLQTLPLQVALWDGVHSSGVAGTVKNLWIWERTGHQRQVISSGAALGDRSVADYSPPPPPSDLRITRAMLFGDVKGFSKLSDADIPNFAKVVMGGVAEVIARYDGQLALKNSWGDGIFLVFDDAGQAADCALAMQEFMAGLDLAAAKLPSHISLRIGAHLGPAYKIDDPILGRPNYWGSHVSRAARIEPVTPEGHVYVTEPFAAVLALHNAGAFACDYVGQTATAKGFGVHRLFLLRRQGVTA
jgi:class 3 adenylate cyclase